MSVLDGLTTTVGAGGTDSLLGSKNFETGAVRLYNSTGGSVTVTCAVTAL